VPPVLTARVLAFGEVRPPRAVNTALPPEVRDNWRMDAADDEPALCAGCGKPWDDVPVGHDVAYPLDGSKPMCSDVTRPVTPEEFMSRLSADG
jgi:hypothetical protein